MRTDEQEIGISINAADKFAYIVVTGYQSYMRKLESLSAEFPEEYTLIHEEKEDGEIVSRSYKVNKRYIRFGKPASEAKKEQGRKAAERMRVYP